MRAAATAIVVGVYLFGFVQGQDDGPPARTETAPVPTECGRHLIRYQEALEALGVEISPLQAYRASLVASGEAGP